MQKSLSRHTQTRTQRTDCSIWTIEVVGN